MSLTDVIDRSLNYGRFILRFLSYAGRWVSVIDIGAGRGDDLMLASSIHPGAKLHAIEVHQPCAETIADKGVSVYSLNIESKPLPFPDGSVDLVIANQVLEHVKVLFWRFHEISSVVPVGGKMIIGVPNLAALYNRTLLAFDRQPSSLKNSSAHIRGYTRQDLLSFMESCFPSAYRLLRFGGSNFYPFPPILARPLASLFPNMSWGIFFLLEKQRDYSREFLDYPSQERLETNFYVGQQ